MKQLNPEQKLAVTTTEGYVLVLAGAGSGKTRVLTERIAYLIKEKCISPERVLAFTFTNKAAQEMKSRVERLLRRKNLPLWIGTFHATGLRILRREAKYIGYENNFAIFDEEDSVSLIKDIMKKKDLRLDEYSPKEARWKISLWKNEIVTPEEAMERATEAHQVTLAKVYAEYVSQLKRYNAMDFDDLITKVVELFVSFPKVKERYARQFKYVLVDEFQDTNKMQMLMIDALSSFHKNLFVVGDDDQAIYGWRGATVENILQFDRIYNGTAIIRLEQNYRSTNRILRAANRVISYNAGRKGKNLWSKKGEGELIRVVHTEDEQGEAEGIVETIIELIRSGFKRKEIAVLYRTHAQSRAIEKALITSGLPYQMVGGVRFYERKEIKDILAYLRLLNNPMDDVSFRRIVNVPRRGIGESTIRRIEEAQGDRGLFNTARDKSFLRSVPPRQRSALEEFCSLMEPLLLKAQKMSVYELMELIISETGYREYIVRELTNPSERLENIDELLAEARRFNDRAEKPVLSVFLEEVALLSDIDTMRDDETVALMTLHNSKGLEFRAVIIAGLEEGLLPHYSSFEDEEELEEERRLFYVGMTRAKERLYLFSAASRMRYTGWSGSEPSRFLSELPDDCIEVMGLQKIGSGISDLRMFKDFREDRSYASRFRVGVKVYHPNFGRGTIRGVEGSGKNLMVTVYFPGLGDKKFIASYAPFVFLD